MKSGVPSGRRRDPDVDRRVLAAALETYGKRGWGGFSVEAVAKQAGAGKASIYLRWPTKEDLLVDALHQLGSSKYVETGDVRSDLLSLATQLLQQYLSDEGHAAMRLAVETEQIPAVAEAWSKLRESQILAARRLVRNAIDRGQLPESTSVTLLLDLLCGATTMHVQATPPRMRHHILAEIDDYARRLVDFLLTAVRADEGLVADHGPDPSAA
ncbi:TetR/AcrR family transcriptional regulator [Gordonia sp. KTR9]|uniref:TetR/AcrR family transcriptional regulator n=1 Tax=Gordonia sp. KTR9 TaxID=337191 RepID=UPI00027DEA01|nr:TetR/AcrR family transcriptional regulator [Gordonia sp. KTR9]AFR49444.1 Transcriptional regulator [Gordonia sp. KTR9]